MADQGAGEELLTLTEVANRTGISMPTLQRYKKEYQARLPTVGKGRKQRYPASSLAVFEEIKKENIARRGRPRKNASGGAKAKPARQATRAAKAEPARSDLLTLTEIGERTGISYPTLVRYVKMEGNRIPHEGEGRRRRYYPQAVAMFQQLRSQSRRGRAPKSKTATGDGAPSSTRAARTPAAAGGDKLGQRVSSLEKSQDRLERQIQELIQQLKKPITVTLQRGR